MLSVIIVMVLSDGQPDISVALLLYGPKRFSPELCDCPTGFDPMSGKSREKLWIPPSKRGRPSYTGW